MKKLIISLIFLVLIVIGVSWLRMLTEELPVAQKIVENEISNRIQSVLANDINLYLNLSDVYENQLLQEQLGRCIENNRLEYQNRVSQTTTIITVFPI